MEGGLSMLLCLSISHDLPPRHILSAARPVPGGSGSLMPRTPARFSQADIARAVRAVAQTGEDMEVVIERDGTIRILRRVPVAENRRVDERREYRL